MKVLHDWFPDARVTQKREELRSLIIELQQKLNPSLEYDATRDIIT